MSSKRYEKHNQEKAIVRIISTDTALHDHFRPRSDLHLSMDANRCGLGQPSGPWD